MLKINTCSISSNLTKPNFQSLPSGMDKKNIKFNNGQLAVDTISFKSKGKSVSQREYDRLNIDPQKYQPFPSQIKESEKGRRELQLKADTIGVQIDLPNQEDYAEALHTKLELQRAANKIKQAEFQYNKAKDYGKSEEEIDKAYEKIALAELKSQEIKDNVPADKKEKSEKIIAQYEEAEQKVTNTIKDIKINTLVELLGEDLKGFMDKEKIQQLPNNRIHFDSFSNFENVKYMEGIIALSIITKDLDKKPQELTQKDVQLFNNKTTQDELMEQIYNIGRQYTKLVEAKCYGVKSNDPSEEEISLAHEKYEKGLLDSHVITRNEYDYD